MTLTFTGLATYKQVKRDKVLVFYRAGNLPMKDRVPNKAMWLRSDFSMRYSVPKFCSFLKPLIIYRLSKRTAKHKWTTKNVK